MSLAVRRGFFGGLIAAGFAALFAFSVWVADRPDVTLDLSLPWAISEFHTQNAYRFAEAVRAATDGRVVITVHPGAALGIKGPDSLRAVSDGIVPMVEMAGFQQTGSEPILGLEALPFLIDDHAELAQLYTIIRPAVEAAFERHGVKVLYIVPWPNQNLFSNRVTPTLEDLSGLKVRTLDANTTDLMEASGLVAVQMPSPDVLPSLASGAIDATLTSTTTAVAQKYWDFLTYTVRTNHNWACNMMVINQSAWEKLSVADRAIIEQIARDLEPEFWAVSERDDKAMLARLEAEGMTTHALPDAWRGPFLEDSRALWAAYVTRVPDARPLLEAYLAKTGRLPLAPATSGTGEGGQ